MKIKKITIDFTDEIMAPIMCVSAVVWHTHLRWLCLSSANNAALMMWDMKIWKRCTRTFFIHAMIYSRPLSFITMLVEGRRYTSIMLCSKLRKTYPKRVSNSLFHNSSWHDTLSRNILFWWLKIDRIASLAENIERIECPIIIDSRKVEQRSRMTALQFWHAKNCLYLYIAFS